MSDGPVPMLPPKEAIDFFRAKGLAKSFSYQDIEKALHDFVFTVAKMLRVSLLEEVADLIGSALEDGRSPQDLRGQLKQLLRERGWWGRQSMVDPLTGAQDVVQLGSNRRVRTIVNTNLRTAYAAGRWARQQRVKAQLPILVYKSRKDGRERPQHGAWHDTALPVDHAWWQTHYPPCDWGCRCRTVSMTRGQAERRKLKVGEKPPYFGMRKWVNKRTGEVQEIEKGIGAGWDYHPGRAALDGLAPEPLFPFSIVDPDGEAIADAAGAWLSAFGLSSAGVWRDVAGYPLPISPAWLDGMPATMQAQAAQAARAIVAAESIRLFWIMGKDRRRMLVRRYAGGGWIVDVGTSFWRFRRGVAGTGGAPIWPEEKATADWRTQPRDKNGRWTGHGMRAFVASADGAPDGARHSLGAIADNAPTDLIGFDRQLLAETVRKVMRKHGPGGTGLDRHPIHPRDFELIPIITATGRVTDRSWPNGQRSIEYEARINGIVHVYVERAGTKRRRTVSKTFFKMG